MLGQQHVMDLAAEALDSQPWGTNVSLAYLSGSRLAGLDHANSDYDMHLVMGSGPRPTTRQLTAGSLQFQITMEDEAAMRDLLAAGLQVKHETPADRRLLKMSKAEERSLYRVFHSRAVVASPQWLPFFDEEWRRGVQTAFVGSASLDHARFCDDIAGMVEKIEFSDVGILHSAYLGFCTALGVALNRAGDLYNSDKFLMARADRLPELADVLAAAGHVLGDGDCTARSRAARLHRLGQGVCVQAQFADIPELVGGDFRYAVPPEDGVLASPAVGLVRYPGGQWSLAGGARSFTISGRTALQWLHYFRPDLVEANSSAHASLEARGLAGEQYLAGPGPTSTAR